MSELFERKKHKCSMCEGKGEISDGHKYELRLGEDPSKCEPNELAVVLAISGEMATIAEKLGLDPTQIKVDFGFKKTGHHMCFTMAK